MNDMGYNLFLDDVRMPKETFDYTFQQIYLDEEWIIVRNYDEFVKIIEEKGLPEIISFDHDLADAHYEHQERLDNNAYDIMEEKTGYHCAKWLIIYCINKKELPATILIHSMNPAGSLNIKSLFKSYLKSPNLPSSPT
jgi:hypothetical protein